jgi:16S rRNA processing protein RimM
METDFAIERLQPGSVLYVKRPHRRTPRPIKVESGRKQNGDTYLVKFEQVNTRLAAAAFKEFSLYVRKEDRPELQTNEYLVRDLVDVPVYAEVHPPTAAESHEKEEGADRKPQLQYIGVVSGVVPPDELCDPSLAALMHAMLEVKLDRKDSVEVDDPDGPGDTMCLIPLVPSIVTSVVLKDDEKMIVINPPEGLLDLTYVEKKKFVIRGFLPAKSAYLTDAERELLKIVSILQFPER